MIRAILYHERLNFLFRGPALPIAFSIIAAFAYAGWSGDQWRDAQINSLTVFETDANTTLNQWRSTLADIEAGEIEATTYEANPMSISFPATIPPGSLGDFAVGDADLQPASAEISPWRDLTSTFGRYQFDNPTTLSMGAFDVAFVIILLMPILMIAVSFDVLAKERSQGSLPVVLTSPISISSLVWTRLLYRNGLIWLMATGMMVFLAIVNDPGGDRFEKFGLWLGFSLVYAFFWLGLIAFCVARFRSAMGTLGAMLGCWLLLVVLIPATVTTAADALYPTPSRLALLSEIREMKGTANREVDEMTDGFLLDHPDLSVGDENLPSYFRAAFLSNVLIREATKPIVDEYDSARAGREQTIRWAQHLSPSIIARRALMITAGADLARQHRFQAQVRDSLADLADVVGPAVVSRNRITLTTFDQLKPFEFEEVTVRQIAIGLIWPAGYLLIVSILLTAIAHWRLRGSTI